MTYYPVLGINITNIDNVDDFLNHVREYKRGYAIILNVHLSVCAQKDLVLKDFFNNAIATIADGKPISIVHNILYQEKIKRLTGPEIFDGLLKKQELKHYLVGSTPEVLRKIIVHYDNICGYYSPPFRKMTENELVKLIDDINSKNPDFIWIGLGAPKQEHFIRENVDKLNSGIMIGVGAAFDYQVGRIKRAPQWMQSLSLEWLYRLLQEPRRLFRRYMITNSLYMYYVITDLTKQIFFKKK